MTLGHAPARAIPLLLVVLAAGLAVWGGRAEGDDPAGPSPIVATVGRETIRAADLNAFWFDRHRDGWIRTVESLLDERIVAHEARRLGLSVPAAEVEKAVVEEVAARTRQLEATYGEAADLAVTVRDAYGMDLATWRRTILTPRVEMQLLLMRVVRLDSRRRERLEARVIVLLDAAAAQRVLGKLRVGADFSLTALKESQDPTAESGGVLPPIARGDLTLPEVEAQLFAAQEGTVVGPLRVEIGGVAQWHLYKVIGRLPPWTGTRGEMLARLEEDLAETPLGRPEFERWRARMRRDFRVQVRDPAGGRLLLPSLGG